MGVGQGRIGIAVDLVLAVVRRDDQRPLGDLEVAQGPGREGVVAGREGARGTGDDVGVGAHVLGVGGDRAAGHAGDRDGPGGVAVDVAAEAVGRGRVGRAVDLGLVGGVDRQLGRRDLERLAGGEADRVVEARRERALVDGVRPDVLTGGAREGAGEDAVGVAVEERAVGVGQGRIGIAVDLVLAVVGVTTSVRWVISRSPRDPVAKV